MSKIQAVRTQDIDCGHRVVGHGGKCKHIHGHRYEISFTVQAKSNCDPLDSLGMVIDFSVIKSHLCQWVLDNWDHHLLLWEKDPWSRQLIAVDDTVVLVPFNPTAENIAMHLVEIVGPIRLVGTGVELVEVTVHETQKCSATYTKGKDIK